VSRSVRAGDCQPDVRAGGESLERGWKNAVRASA
jgi:hypothetical protein